jgi:hypothetical protein
MRVMVRRDCRIRQRDRAATTAARSGDFSELFDGHHPRVRFDVRNAPCGVNVNADDVRIFLQPFFDEAGARLTAQPPNRNDERP